MYREQITRSSWLNEDVGVIMLTISIAVLIIWDAMTLILYAAKILMLYRKRKTRSVDDIVRDASIHIDDGNDEVQARILSILYKIVIITLFYEIMIMLFLLLIFNNKLLVMTRNFRTLYQI